MSVVSDRVDHLQMIVEEAESLHNDPESKKLRVKTGEIVATLESMDPELKWNGSDELTNLFNSCQKARAFLGFEGSVDITTGNEASEKVQAILTAGVTENEDQRILAIDLVDRWNKVKRHFIVRKPRDKSDADPNEPDFGFATEAFCNECDQVVAREGVRVGSTRWAHLKHLVKTHHGEHEIEAFGTGPEWKAARDAMAGGVEEVSVGQYRIYRVATEAK